MSLYIYFTKTLIANIRKFFNVCIYRLFNIKLFDLSIHDQASSLKQFNFLPFDLRLVYRLSIFSYKIMKAKILIPFYNNLYFKDLSFSRRGRNNEILNVPFEATVSGSQRLGVFLPKFINTVIKSSYEHNYKDFIDSTISNIYFLYDNFSKNFFP